MSWTRNIDFLQRASQPCIIDNRARYVEDALVITVLTAWLE